jgi:hypothetical protein
MLREVTAVHCWNNIKHKEQCGAKLKIFNFPALGTLETTVHGGFH